MPCQGMAATLSSPAPSLRSLLWSPPPPPLSGSNSLKITGDLLGVERTSSSCSSGMLGMSGYSRSCADLSSLTRGKVLWDHCRVEFIQKLCWLLLVELVTNMTGLVTEGLAW